MGAAREAVPVWFRLEGYGPPGCRRSTPWTLRAFQAIDQGLVAVFAAAGGLETEPVLGWAWVECAGSDDDDDPAVAQQIEPLVLDHDGRLASAADDDGFLGLEVGSRYAERVEHWAGVAAGATAANARRADADGGTAK